MRFLFWFVLLFILSGCVPSFETTEKDRIYFRIVKTPSIDIRWFTYEAAFAESPDFIVAQKDGKIDTICRSDNIADLYVVDRNKIVIGFFGRPGLYLEPVKIAETSFGCPIKVDTTFTAPLPHAINGFSEKN